MRSLTRIGLIASLACFVSWPAAATLQIPQSASTTVVIGPFVSSADGSTIQSALTINASDVILSKAGGTGAAKNTGGCAANSGMPGYYNCTFNATDTGTAGTLQVSIALSGSLPVYHDFQVGGYSIASGGISESSFATTAGSIAPLGITRQGTAQAATSTTVTLDASAPYGDNTNIGSTLWVKGSTNGNYWQACSVSAYVASTKVATVACPSGFVVPTGTISYQLFGVTPASGGGLDAAGVRAAVGLASPNLDTQLSGIQSDTDNLQTRVPTALVSGRMDATLGPDAVNSSSLATSAVTELWSVVGTEPAAKPAWGTSTMKQIMEWAAAWSINAVTTTSTTKALRNNANSANLVTCAVSDNGTTFTLSACTP